MRRTYGSYWIRSAATHLVSALPYLYKHAIADGLINEAHNPASRIGEPTRLSGTRRALPDGPLAEINQVAATTGERPGAELHLELHHPLESVSVPRQRAWADAAGVSPEFMRSQADRARPVSQIASGVTGCARHSSWYP